MKWNYLYESILYSYRKFVLFRTSQLQVIETQLELAKKVINRLMKLDRMLDSFIGLKDML